MRLIGMRLIGMRPMGMHLVGVHLIGLHLMGVGLTGMYLYLNLIPCTGQHFVQPKRSLDGNAPYPGA
jgi:hypothetical protein